MASFLSHAPFIIIRLFCKPWFYCSRIRQFSFQTFQSLSNQNDKFSCQNLVTISASCWILQNRDIWIFEFQNWDCNFKQLIAIPKIWDFVPRIKTWFEVFKGRVIWPQNVLYWSTRSNLGQVRSNRINLLDLKLFLQFQKISQKLQIFWGWNLNRKWGYFENYLISCNGIWDWPHPTCKQID